MAQSTIEPLSTCKVSKPHHLSFPKLVNTYKSVTVRWWASDPYVVTLYMHVIQKQMNILITFN